MYVFVLGRYTCVLPEGRGRKMLSRLLWCVCLVIVASPLFYVPVDSGA